MYFLSFAFHFEKMMYLILIFSQKLHRQSGHCSKQRQGNVRLGLNSPKQKLRPGN